MTDRFAYAKLFVNRRGRWPGRVELPALAWMRFSRDIAFRDSGAARAPARARTGLAGRFRSWPPRVKRQVLTLILGAG